MKNTTFVLPEVPAEQYGNRLTVRAAGAFTATVATPCTFPVSGKQLIQI